MLVSRLLVGCVISQVISAVSVLSQGLLWGFYNLVGSSLIRLDRGNTVLGVNQARFRGHLVSRVPKPKLGKVAVVTGVASRGTSVALVRGL